MRNKPRISENTDIYMLVDLDLRIIRCLRRHDIFTVGQLSEMSSCELFQIRGIGMKSIKAIKYALSFYDVV